MLSIIKSLFIFLSIGTLFAIILLGRNVRKVIISGSMKKNKFSKIALLFEIQHDVFAFRYNEWAVGMCLHSQKGKHNI